MQEVSGAFSFTGFLLLPGAGLTIQSDVGLVQASGLDYHNIYDVGWTKAAGFGKATGVAVAVRKTTRGGGRVASPPDMVGRGLAVRVRGRTGDLMSIAAYVPPFLRPVGEMQAAARHSRQGARVGAEDARASAAAVLGDGRARP